MKCVTSQKTTTNLSLDFLINSIPWTIVVIIVVVGSLRAKSTAEMVEETRNMLKDNNATLKRLEKAIAPEQKPIASTD